MNRLLVASLGITVAALVVGFALGTQFQLASTAETQTSTLSSFYSSTEFITTSVQVNSNQVSTSTGGTTSTICSFSASAGVLVHLVNDQGANMSRIPVSSYTEYYCANERQLIANPVNVTNSSGWADLQYGQIGTYYLSFGFGYPPIYYNFTVPTQAQATAVVTYHLYSGNMTVLYCSYLIPLYKCIN